jgi:hypothetical protein
VLVVPATWEAEIGRIMFPDQPEQKYSRDAISAEKTGCGSAHNNHRDNGKPKIGELRSRPTRPKSKTISKTARAKKAGGMPQLAECLHEALSSNSNTAKK